MQGIGVSTSVQLLLMVAGEPPTRIPRFDDLDVTGHSLQPILYSPGPVSSDGGWDPDCHKQNTRTTAF